MTDDENLCSRCARGGSTCCQNTRIFLTQGDMERIAASGARDFHEYLHIPWAGDAELDPAWRRTFRPDGLRRVLRHKVEAERDCIFLGHEGCRLELADRPLLCRLYPFDYDDNTIKGVHGHRCPSPESANPALLLALLGMNREEAEDWRQQFYREIDAEFPVLIE